MYSTSLTKYSTYIDFLFHTPRLIYMQLDRQIHGDSIFVPLIQVFHLSKCHIQRFHSIRNIINEFYFLRFALMIFSSRVRSIPIVSWKSIFLIWNFHITCINISTIHFMSTGSSSKFLAVFSY